MKAIVLAGGRGTRLAPYTTVLPKPLMPIGDMPIMDVVLRQLAHHGFREVIVAVGYLAELITAYCGDGSRYGIKLDYIREDRPLGTAGPIANVAGLDDPFLVMNGDVLTTLDYGALWRHHHEHGGIATLASYERSVNIDLGLIESDEDGWVTNYVEKPTMKHYVSSGIYVFDPAVRQYMTPGERLDLPDLVLDLLRRGEKVSGYRAGGYWLDIGRREDYETAIREFEANREQFVPPS